MAKQIYVGTVGGNKRAINVIIGTLSGNKGKEIPIVGTAAGNRPCMQYYTPTIYVLSQHTSGNADIKKVEFSSPAVTTTIVPDTGVTTAGGIAVNPSLNKLYIATGAARYLKSYDLLGNLIASYLDSVYCKNIIIGVSDNLSWGAGTSYTSIRRTGESLGSTPNSYSTGASTEVVLVGEESVGNRYFFARNSKIGKMRFDTTMFAISKSTVDCADVSPDYYYYYLASYILYKCDTDDALTQMNTTDLSAHYGYTTALFMRINRAGEIFIITKGGTSDRNLTIFKYDNNLNFLYYKVFSSGEFTDPDNTTGVDVRDVVCDDAGNIYLIRSTNQITKINGDDGSIIETANIGGAYHSPVMYACISNGEQPYFNSYHSAQ